MKDKSYQTGIYIAVGVLFVLNLTAVIFNIRQLWGINIAKFLPVWWQVMIFLIIAISFIPAISEKLNSICDRLSKFLEASRKRQIVFTLIFSATFFIFCLIYFAQTKFLGDGYLRIRQISTGKFWLPTEIGDFYLHAAFFRYILEPLGEDAIALSYHIISAICGIAFVIGVFRLASYLKSSQSVVIFLVIFSSGMTVVFFGYVESYSILAAIFPFIILTALKVIDGQSSISKFIVLFLLAGLFHSVSLAILSGLLISVIAIHYSKNIINARRLLRWLSLSAIIGVAMLYITRAANIIDTGVYLLPLFPQEGYAMGFFTLHHLSNLFNWFALSALAGVPIWLSLANSRSGNTTDQSKRRITLAVFMLVSPAIFILFFAPQLSGPRDWDLFSLAAFLFIPAGLIIFMARDERPLPLAVIPATLIALAVTFSLAGVNSSVIKSCDRFEEIIEVARYKNLYKEYSTLYNLSLGMPILYDRQLRYAHKAWDEPPYNQFDSVYITSQLANIYIENNNRFMARKFIGYLNDADSANLPGHLILMHYYRKFNEPHNLPRLAERMVRLFPDNAVGLMNAAVIFLQVNQIERGHELMQRAYDLDSIDISVIENYATLQYRFENYERCIELAGRLIENDSSSFTAHYHIAAAYFKLNNMAKSAEYLGRAAKLVKSSEEAAMVQNLRQAMKSRR